MRACTAGVFLVAAAVAGAAEPTPVPADSIAGAKKEFSEIRAGAAPDVGSVAPTIDLKDLGPVPGASPAPTPTPVSADRVSDPSRKRPSDTWLLDAMDAKGERTQSTRPGDELLRTDSELLAENGRGQAAGSKGSAASAEPREKEAPKEPQHPAFNPLDAYMGSWISARDHDLLVPRSKGEPFADADLEKVHDEAPGDLGSSAPAQTSELSLPTFDSAGWLEAKGNPYLAAIDPPASTPVAHYLAAPETTGDSLFTFPEALSGGGGAAVDPQAVDGFRSFLPDFAQPADDDKYFRQLKKF